MIHFLLFTNSDLPRLQQIGGLGNAHAHHAGCQAVSHVLSFERPGQTVNFADVDIAQVRAPYAQIDAALKAATVAGLSNDMVIDPSYPLNDGYVVQAVTTAWIRADSAKALAPFVQIALTPVDTPAA